MISNTESFSPSSISTNHIRRAIELIKSGQESVKPSQIYDVIVDGERYPPKEVMRIAHGIATGNPIWQLAGGKPTNSLLEKLGFEVRTKASDYSARKNYWKIAPDEKARRWNEFYQKGIMAISFRANNSGDLRQYKSLRDLEIAIGKENSNEALSLWVCCHAPVGDVVFANKGRDTVVGVGIIDGPYEYNAEQDFPHIRKVKWLSDKEWTYTTGQFATEKRKRPNLFRIDTLSKTEVGPEILNAYLEKYPEYEEVFTQNNIWPIYEEESYENFVKRVAAFKSPGLIDRYFDFLNAVIQNNGIERDDESLFCSLPKHGNIISMTYNQRYVSSIKKDNSGYKCSVMLRRGDLSRIKNLEIIRSSKFGDTEPKLDWIEFKITDGQEFSDHLIDLVSGAVKAEKETGKKYSYRIIHKNIHNDHIYEAITDISLREKLMMAAFDAYIEGDNEDQSDMNEKTGNIKSKLPLNTILFGPPGTGKTYNSVDHALALAGTEMNGLSRELKKAKYDELVSSGQIVFTTFHQSMSYEDFIEGIKPVQNEANGQLTYEVRNGIFRRLCEVAQSNWEASKRGKSGAMTFEDAFEQFKEEWEEDPSMKIPTKKKDYTITHISPRSISFKKASGGTAHTLSINTLREFYYGTREYPVGGLGVYYPGLVEKLRKYVGSQQPIELKNYVIIIDEINRGNVSQIFGELITLIEDDKRLGKGERVKVTLPYSGEEFGVPPNLFIVGTMNTADRSVEALDTALRRRFSFIEMAPKYDLPELQHEVSGHKLGSILYTINKRIEKLLDKDHLIGHSYLLGAGNSIENLKPVFSNKILPLLQEYFFGDYSKIGLVLGEGFFENSDDENENVFASFRDTEISELADRLVHRLKEPSAMTDDEFMDAINQMMVS